MRCTFCNVDLCDEYTLCPLCGMKAVNDKPVIKYFKNAPYPHCEQPSEFTSPEIPRPGISAERIKAFFTR